MSPLPSLLRQEMARTLSPRVLGNFTPQLGAFRLDFDQKLFARNYADPILVNYAARVGTKQQLASDLGIYDGIGIDLVALAVNELASLGAEPLYLMAHLWTAPTNDHAQKEVLHSLANGCKLAGCSLLGGQVQPSPTATLEMAGFAVGVCELNRMVQAARIERGDVVLALASSGLHCSGFDLALDIVRSANLDLHRIYTDLDATKTLGQVLLTPTRIYAPAIVSLLHHYRVKHVVSGLAAVADGGLPAALQRLLPPNLDARIERGRWQSPAIFPFLAKAGKLDADRIDRSFNQGIGQLLLVRPAFAQSVMAQLRKSGHSVWRIGRIARK